MTSWWTDPKAQQCYVAFRLLAQAQWARMACDREAMKINPLTGLAGSAGRSVQPAANASGEVAA